MKKVIILEFGSDYTDEVADALKKLNISAEIAPLETKASEIEENYDAAILSGGPFTIFENDLEDVDPELFNMSIPVFATGRGMQVMIKTLGGTVTPAGYQFWPEQADLNIHNTESGLFKGLDEAVSLPLGFDAKVSELPEGFDVVANGEGRPFGAIENQAKNLYGVQFVFNPAESDYCRGILENFVNEILG